MEPLIDRATMEQVFAPEDLLTTPDHLLTGIAHAPTRAFLRDVGLPDRERWFESPQELAEGRVRIGGEAWQRVAQEYPNCPFDMSVWLTVGGIALDSVMVDTVTGLVYSIPDGGSPHLLNSGVDALAYFLHALEVEREAYDPEADGEVDPDGAVERLLELMRAADPAALEYPESTWSMVLRYVGNMMQD
ncbi:SUKH-4 family immunity protein [Kitasatospora viridis]|uniref:SUKH-4 immunity protein of toxin-antitoxin system n=1 Tax=Kitasatospora viridis TaxID=281105 RepID=A0A561SE84_9ACTN|nr:SUKH-4 family immunity protein [Kitasatospora viridis]TWF73183.1 SUKH-4 immunity protein of toxin-antitoxin system [Kitasatospora viridis]